MGPGIGIAARAKLSVRDEYGRRVLAARPAHRWYARCTVQPGRSSPTDSGISVSYVWDDRHVTEPSERVGPRP